MLLPTDSLLVKDLDPPLTACRPSGVTTEIKSYPVGPSSTENQNAPFEHWQPGSESHRQLLKPVRYLVGLTSNQQPTRKKGSHVDHLTLHHPLPSDCNHPPLCRHHSQCECKPRANIHCSMGAFTHFNHLPVRPWCRLGGWCHMLDLKWSTLTFGTHVTAHAILWRTAILLMQVRQGLTMQDQPKPFKYQTKIIN